LNTSKASKANLLRVTRSIDWFTLSALATFTPRSRARSKIKGLLRIKKIALIVSMNPEWKDLSEGWYVRHQYQPENA
jgi:predicted GIY-YIG superfamily endonuclease